MEIGIDELDDFDNENGIINSDDTTTQDNEESESNQVDPDVSEPQPQDAEEDFVSSLLKSRGIKDITKIKFENEDGTVEEVDWNTLSIEDQLNIFNSSSENLENQLDESEIQLISTIRNSGMTPAEYIQYIEQSGVDRYVQNSQQENYAYNVDQYSDDDLYIFDLISRTGITEEEAQDALERAKANEALFAKQMNAIRNEYIEAEKDQLMAAKHQQDQLDQERYNQFTQSIADQIDKFKDFSGYNIDMDDEEMQELYEFITGFDAAGNNYFNKALTDPKVVVQMAYFALNGQRLIDDITEYFQKEITNVGRENYAKGLADAQKKKDKTNVVFKDKQKPTKQVVEDYNDLDDF